MKTTKISVPASDGFLLDAKIFEPENVSGAIMINSGTGIPKEFYARLAQHLAAQNYAVMIYDYRGIGGSRLHH